MLPRASDALLELIRAHDTAGVDAMLDADPVQRTHGGPGGETLVLYACYTGAPDVAPLLRDGRTIIYGILIVLVVVVFPQGLITPNLFRRKGGDKT